MGRRRSRPTGTIRKILIHPSAPNIAFACASNGIFRSINSGTSWTQVHNISKEDIEFKPNDQNIMYATRNNAYRSTDNGVTWTAVGAAQASQTPAALLLVFLLQILIMFMLFRHLRGCALGINVLIQRAAFFHLIEMGEPLEKCAGRSHIKPAQMAISACN